MITVIAPPFLHRYVVITVTCFDAIHAARNLGVAYVVSPNESPAGYKGAGQ